MVYIQGARTCIGSIKYWRLSLYHIMYIDEQLRCLCGILFMIDVSVGFAFMCGHNYYYTIPPGTTIEVTSPFLTGRNISYPNDCDASATLYVLPQQQIQLRLRRLVLEFGYDFVWAANDDVAMRGSAVLFNCTGSACPAFDDPVISFGPHLTLRFHSDPTVSETGFIIEAKAVSIPSISLSQMSAGHSAPALTIDNSSQMFIVNTPEFPSNYEHNFVGGITVNSSLPGKSLRIIFPTFMTENSNIGDTLTILASTNASNSIWYEECKGTYCHSITLNNSVSSLHLVFYSDSAITDKGFYAIIFVEDSSNCDCRYTAANTGADPMSIFSTIALPSPRFPDQADFCRCQFKWNPPRGGSLSARNIYAQGSVHHSTRLLLSDSLNRPKDCLSHGQKICRQYTTGASSHLYIDFVARNSSDHTISLTGSISAIRTPAAPPTTRAPAYCNCGSPDIWLNFEGDTNNVRSPNYPGAYPSNCPCHWTVHAPSGYEVRATFSSFHISRFDYVRVYDGRGDWDSILGICSGSNCDSVTSTLGALYITFSPSQTQAPGFLINFRAVQRGLSTGTITGIIAAVILILVGLSFLIACLAKRRSAVPSNRYPATVGFVNGTGPSGGVVCPVATLVSPYETAPPPYAVAARMPKPGQPVAVQPASTQPPSTPESLPQPLSN